MKRKNADKMLILGLSAAVLSGCNAEFDPSKEEVMEMYGPPLIEEVLEEEGSSEIIIEETDSKETMEEGEADSEEILEEEFSPELVCKHIYI